MLGAIGSVGPVLIAHQGGWDEILLVAGPILIIAALLAVAKRRVDRIASETAAEAEQHPVAPGRAGDPDHTPDIADTTDDGVSRR